MRNSRRVILSLVGVVVLGAVIAGIVIVDRRNADAPLAAVRAYVDAIARGDGAAANAAVDPRAFAPDVDPALAADALAAAAQRITVDGVRLSYDADPDADVVGVQVEYRIGTNSARAELRARRTGTGLVDTWSVVDPLLVPVRVEANEFTFDSGSVGAVSVPVGGPRFEGFPERRFFLYPGFYELRGRQSRYLSAQPKPLVVLRGGSPEPADQLQSVDTYLSYQPTPELTRTVQTKLTKHIETCFAKQPTPKGCPDAVYDYASRNPKLRRQPSITSITTYQVDYKPDGTTEPSLRLRAENGSLTYTDRDGETETEWFYAYGRITVSPQDDLTITFTTEL